MIQLFLTAVFFSISSLLHAFALASANSISISSLLDAQPIPSPSHHSLTLSQFHLHLITPRRCRTPGTDRHEHFQ
ncbi:hypothetical protein PGTUg99_003186 [Puccinia graminis f. sp. tritici]|uniref:Uncharacterized protein n=1 Tax=Puccinia graminis f. sp. tritici TaxID=56615 RepID=A0A5B0PSH8_PUCGR|nr:hypothetical protein PGTUg99_003186 [Puccinia graminis f. sp. tritici]